MNHAASKVLYILAQNASATRSFGNDPANPLHAPSFSADEEVYEEVFKSIDTDPFCAWIVIVHRRLPCDTLLNLC
jgi:hypothetical protein